MLYSRLAETVSVKHLGAIFGRTLNITLDRAQRHPEIRSNLSIGCFVKQHGFEDRSCPGRQIGERPQQSIHIRADLDGLRRAWCFIRDVEERLDFSGSCPYTLAPTEVLADIDRGPEQIVSRIA